MDPQEGDDAVEAGRRMREDMDEEVRPGRPWLLIIAALLLAGLAAWTGLQWKQGADREGKLRAELKQVYLEAEQLRGQAVQAQQRAALLEKQMLALSAEREATTKRLEELEAQLSAVKGRPGAKRPSAPARPAQPRR
jgi:uncharacterized protein HemX